MACPCLLRSVVPLLITFLCSTMCVHAQSNPILFPFGASESDLTLNRNLDDTSSPELRLQTPVLFYGQLFNSLYINENGLVSFLTEIPTFVNIQFPLDYPTIAPLYSDVDTRIVGTVHYRETQADEQLERARTFLSDHFSRATNFQPSSLVIVTWENVGFYDRKSDKSGDENLHRICMRNHPRADMPECPEFLDSRETNTFQLVLASDGGETYALFIYKDIQWIQGTGKNPSLPDAKAQAGMISGNGPYFSLKGSGTDQVSSLHKRSNAGEDGIWAFRVGRIGDSPEEADLNIDLVSSSETSSSCAAGGRTQCHSQALCVDFEPGYCCKCAKGFYGNGRLCLQDDIPLRINGKVKGVVNGMSIDDADLFSYVLPQDGRSYTAIAKISERLGYDLQTVLVLGTSIGWLFSTSVKSAPNGFMLTGGIMNYTADISFYQTGQKVSIQQIFNGLDVFNHLKVDTRIHGTTPLVPVGKTIEVNDIKMQFTRSSPGILRSRSSHSYTVEGTSAENPFSVEQTIEFSECPWSPPLPSGMETTTMRVGRNYIVYDVSQQIARYAITSKVTPVEGEDPCKENKDKCGPNSSCIVDGDNYRCLCNLGYEENYRYDDSEGSSDVTQCVDVNECQVGSSACDATATCINSPGSYSCHCQPGHVGDGFTCTKVLSCADVKCGANAECVEARIGEPECRCLQGYYGDGLFCYHHTGVDVNPGLPGSSPDCRQVRDLCDPFAECVFSSSSNSYVCSCTQGYSGDGITCHREQTESCDIENNCNPNADCRLDEAINEYTCLCREGFQGDGYTCMRSREYETGVSSRPNPICVLNYCYCESGYIYDDIKDECLPARTAIASVGSVNCQYDDSVCDPNASCLLQQSNYVCVCNDGFSGDGRQCSASDTCASHAECGQFGECAYDTTDAHYYCRCRDGFTGIGKDCHPNADAGCDLLRNCDSNAQCSWDAVKSSYACECKPGYRGNGLTCQEDTLGCNIMKNCGRNSDCKYDSGAKGFRCQCKNGFEGDGFRCRSTLPCYQDTSICDPNAECLQSNSGQTRQWNCKCKQGYAGDGYICKVQSAQSGGQFLIVTKGMSLIKVPLNGEKPMPLAVEPFQTAIGIDVDCPAHKIYWSDVATRVIKVAYANGTEKTAFLDEEIGSPEGLAVDYASQNLYWTDSSRDTIEVASLKTKKRRTLINSGLVNPRGIAVYPQRGRLFWSDWNRDYPKIEYAGLDGKDRQVLVGEGLALPNSLIVDPTADQLCWADAGTHNIECVGIDGRNRRTFVSKVKYPFGLAMASDIFYWSDWETKNIESASRITGEANQSFEVSLGGPGKLYGVVLVPSTCPQMYSPCEYNICSEDHLCLPNLRGGRSCMCSQSASSHCQDLIN